MGSDPDTIHDTIHVFKFACGDENMNDLIIHAKLQLCGFGSRLEMELSRKPNIVNADMTVFRCSLREEQLVTLADHLNVAALRMTAFRALKGEPDESEQSSAD